MIKMKRRNHVNTKSCLDKIIILWVSGKCLRGERLQSGNGIKVLVIPQLPLSVTTYWRIIAWSLKLLTFLYLIDKLLLIGKA